MRKTENMAAAARGAATALLVAGSCLVASASPREQGTLVIPGKGIAVYAAGDIADCRRFKPEDTGAAKTAARIAQEIERDRDAKVLALGDNTYPIGLFNEFVDCYGPTWGRFKERTLPAPGNHEYYSPEAAGYYRYFGDAAGPGRRGYYSTRIGRWHVISLNSNLKPAAHAEQLKWLEKDLTANRQACTLAFWHHPRYSSGGHGNNLRMDDAWKILVAHGADVVLSAHDHDYERFAPIDGEGNADDARGMRSFVVGTGGAYLTPFRFPQKHSEIADNTTHGVLKLVLKPTGYEWEFLPTEEGGFTDRGSAWCNRKTNQPAK